ncbi:adhesion G protein-coupled receptor D2-like [Ciona intestinalis]
MTLAIKTSDHAMQYDGEHKRSNRWFFAFGWGVPVIFAGFAIVYGLITGTYLEESLPFKEGIVTSSKYKYDRCWLIPQTTIFWSTVIGPTAFILTVNLLILLRVSRFVYLMHVSEVRMRPSQPREGAREVFQQLKRTMRLIVVLVFTLGMPLVIGYLVGIGYTSTVFMYINVVVNGLQGVIVFIVYLVAVKDIRQMVTRKVAQSFEMTELI